MRAYAVAFLLLCVSLAGGYGENSRGILVECDRDYSQPAMTSKTNYGESDCFNLFIENTYPNNDKKMNEISAQQQKSENNASKQEKEELNTYYTMDS